VPECTSDQYDGSLIRSGFEHNAIAMDTEGPVMSAPAWIHATGMRYLRRLDALPISHILHLE